jgi:hypothetical protein
MTGVRRAAEPLRLVSEAKVADLLAGAAASSLEPSGVCVHDSACFVIFDDSSAIACIEDVTTRSPGNRLLPESVGGPALDVEDIAFDPVSGHFFVLVEAVEHRGRLYGEVWEHEVDGTPVGHALLDLVLETSNKGLEGLSCLVRGGEALLLGLCEGNRCKGGEEGKRPGGGRIHVFRRGKARWKMAATIRLPKEVDFVDYASVAVSGDRIAVVSQSSRRLWIGTLDADRFTVASGTIYDFPRDDDGHEVYRNVEGVSWLSEDRLVMVSDRAEEDEGRAKERSLHVFALPAEAGA